MKTIPLTQGQFALVDNDDFKLLSVWKWRAQRGPNTFYAVRHTGEDSKRAILMHRQILGLQFPAIQVDHINHNGLDNQKINLRVCGHTQNHQNQAPRSDRSSLYKGVHQYKDRSNLWRARIMVGGVRLHLGCFNSEEAAARAYDEAALKHFGSFALINFPTKP